MFDPVIERISHLIIEQLDQLEQIGKTCFLVEGLGESKYLQARIKDEFNDIEISVPSRPIT